MNELQRQIEAILFVADEPVPLTQLAQVTETARDTVLLALEEMKAEYEAAERGVVLREIGGGWRMYTHPDVAAYVERFVLAVQQPRLTQAALETLAIVAYKQPVSRQKLAQNSGVDSEKAINST